MIHDGRKHPQRLELNRQPFLLETNVPGIFAAGDVRHGSIKRVATGVGEGSIAVQLNTPIFERVSNKITVSSLAIVTNKILIIRN